MRALFSKSNKGLEKAEHRLWPYLWPIIMNFLCHLFRVTYGEVQVLVVEVLCVALHAEYSVQYNSTGTGSTWRRERRFGMYAGRLKQTYAEYILLLKLPTVVL